MSEHVRVNKQRVCWATHPDFPNHSGRARGRVWHLEHLDKERYHYPATQCGMLIETFVRKVDASIAARRICTPCVTQSEQFELKSEDLAEIVQ